VRLGELHFRTGQWDDAEAAYQRAAELDAGDADLLDHLAELHAARGAFDDAVACSDKAIASAPRAAFYRARGDILAAKGDADEAFDWHRKALDAFLAAAAAGYAPAQRHLAAMYCDVEAFRDPEEAIRWARRDLQTRRTGATLAAMAWALYHAGRPGEAAANMDKALKVKTIDPAVLYQAGLIYPAAGDGARGRLYLRQAAAANPKFQEFHFFR
jgi:tetratricopeptide (TPR) repeat protein